MVDVYDVEDAIRTIQRFCGQSTRCIDCPLAMVWRETIGEDDWMGWHEGKVISHAYCPIEDGTLVRKK